MELPNNEKQYISKIHVLTTLNSLIKVPVLWKQLPKSLAVLTFSCGTIGMNSRFLLVVLLFQLYYRVNFGRFELEINGA